MKHLRLIILLTMFSVAPVQAGLLSDASDAKIIVELKAMYQKMMDQLEELKAQNETLANVRDGINYSIESYQEVKNFNLENIAWSIRRDVDGLTGLDDMSGMPLETQIAILQRDINRRVRDPATTQAERERLKEELASLDAIRKRVDVLAEINQNSAHNMGATSEDLGQRDSSRITAEGVSTLVQIESLREIERTQEQRNRINEEQVLRGLNQQQKKLIEGAQKAGW